MTPHVFHSAEPFPLEAGTPLPDLHVGYRTYGTLNAAGDNVIWICHALTANADPADWWYGLIGEGKCFDPTRHYIVCANMLGSCYGSSGPLTEDPQRGEPWYSRFPMVTVRDMVRSQLLLADHLGVRRIRLMTGGSMGGQQVLEWAVQEPGRIQTLVPIATNARHSAWGIAFNEAQRLGLLADPTLHNAHPDAGQQGMMAARATALISYRNYQTYVRTQTDSSNEGLDGYSAISYQRYQGEKLINRFNAWSYYRLSQAMDSHNLGRGRSSIEEALAGIQAETHVIGISSDYLFPPEEQQYLAAHIPSAQYHEIDSTYGHDGFLVEFDKLDGIIRRLLP